MMPAPGTDQACRVLIVDDSAVARLVFKRILCGNEKFDVVGQACSAQDAIDTLAHVHVDLILLDIEMPGMTGIEAIPHLRKVSVDAPILIVSALCEKNAEASVRAMTMGASDTILKPASATDTADFGVELEEVMLRLWNAHRRASAETEPSPLAFLKRPVAPAVRAPVNCLAIGASTGGLHALKKFLEALPTDIDMPIFVTQHIPPEFVGYFASQMQRLTQRNVSVARHGEPVRKAAMLIAPGGGHLSLKETGDQTVVDLKRTPDGERADNSVDTMFSGVADIYGKSAIGVILSGMGRDGVRGAMDIVSRGGDVIAQDKASAVVWGMPGAAIDNGLATHVASPSELAAYVARRARNFGWG